MYSRRSVRKCDSKLWFSVGKYFPLTKNHIKNGISYLKKVYLKKNLYLEEKNIILLEKYVRVENIEYKQRYYSCEYGKISKFKDSSNIQFIDDLDSSMHECQFHLTKNRN